MIQRDDGLFRLLDRADAGLPGIVLGGRDDDMAIDGEREHESIAVIDVFADEVDAPGGSRHEVGFLPVKVLEVSSRVDREVVERFVVLEGHCASPGAEATGL